MPNPSGLVSEMIQSQRVAGPGNIVMFKQQKRDISRVLRIQREVVGLFFLDPGCPERVGTAFGTEPTSAMEFGWGRSHDLAFEWNVAFS
jgi:hypothetical protein